LLLVVLCLSRLVRLLNIARSTSQLVGQVAFFCVVFSAYAQFFTWRKDKFGGMERSGMPPNSSILIIQKRCSGCHAGANSIRLNLKATKR